MTEIIGHNKQRTLLQTLLNKEHLPQTLLFLGLDGIGKSLVAKEFIAKIFCQNEKKPCGICPNCLQIKSESFPDFIHLQPGENGKIPLGKADSQEKNTIRGLISRLTNKSISGKQFVLIEEADVIRTEGQNALLKTIEEPGESTYIILTANSRSSLLTTILSRCTIINFSGLQPEEVKQILKTKKIREELISEITYFCNGSVKIALKLAEKNNLEFVRHITFEINRFMTEKDFFDANVLTTKNKELTSDFIVNILINVYNYCLNQKVLNKNFNLDNFQILHYEEIEKILQILLALKKDQRFNINNKIALKGLLYSLYN